MPTRALPLVSREPLRCARAVSPGEAVIELAADRQHANPMGTLHGGVLCDIADAAMGIASTLAEGETFATIELKINFLKPVVDYQPPGLRRLVKRGKTMDFVECDIMLGQHATGCIPEQVDRGREIQPHCSQAPRAAPRVSAERLAERERIRPCSRSIAATSRCIDRRGSVSSGSCRDVARPAERRSRA
jgi:uncharacterized protein (TIGR00369 family)